MEGFCRSCLVKYDEPTDLMPYSEKNRRMFVYATGLQVKRNDTFTFQLCKDCHLNMKVACNFKKTSRTSNKKFKNYLACREAGDSVDFCTFLKNNDESLKFRLPMYNDNSTPANRTREDDVESTCTSIQNFMTDILKAEDIPDSEARIIKEVIEEEADILDDSLDSHWLQDDVSIDTDLKMNFSFSPFSTPRSTIDDDHCYTPKRLNDPTATDHKENNTAIELKNNNQDYRFDNFNSNIPENETLKEYVKSSNKCVIDMNLENALKNDSTKKVMLDELIATPPVLPNVSALSTPLINNILFGDKMDIDSENRQNNVYMPPNMIKPEDIDVLYEFFQKSDEKDEIIEEYPVNYDDIYMQEHINENEKNYLNIREQNKNHVAEDIKEPTSPVEDKYCLEKFHCKVCDRRFKNMLAIKTHFRRCHKIKIVAMAPKLTKVRWKMICDYCGKIFASPQCITKHIQNHMNPDQYDCEHCPLSFRTENGLKTHKTTHGIAYQPDDSKKKRRKYVCNICGSVQSSASNYSIHMRRHARKYAMSCAICGKGFYRTSDLDVHMRIHTGERPFACMYCPSKFARQDVLNRHIKCHTGERPYVCPFCNDKFLSASILKRHQLECKSCLERQEEILLENADQNNMDNVTVHYANVSNNAEVSKIVQVFNNTEVPKVVEDSNNAEISKNADVSKNAAVTNNAENVAVTNNAENAAVTNNAENAAVTNGAEVTNNTEISEN